MPASPRRSSEHGSRNGSAPGIVWTRSGAEIDVARPDLLSWSRVTTADIAWAMSGVSRYNGHHRETISVAAHSLALVDQFTATKHATRAQERALILHDAAEIICSDLSSAAKWYLRSSTTRYDEWEDSWSAAFLAMFGADGSVLETDEYMAAHAAVTDDEMGAWDGRDLPGVYRLPRVAAAVRVRKMLENA